MKVKQTNSQTQLFPKRQPPRGRPNMCATMEIVTPIRKNTRKFFNKYLFYK